MLQALRRLGLAAILAGSGRCAGWEFLSAPVSALEYMSKYLQIFRRGFFQAKRLEFLGETLQLVRKLDQRRHDWRMASSIAASASSSVRKPFLWIC